MGYIVYDILKILFFLDEIMLLKENALGDHGGSVYGWSVMMSAVYFQMTQCQKKNGRAER